MNRDESREPTPQERVLVFSGLLATLAGVANIAFGDRASYDFLGGALIVVGSMMALPALVALALIRRQ